MRRRDVIAGLLVAATMARARAQEAGKTYRIASVYSSRPVAEAIKDRNAKGSLTWEFYEELRRLSFVEGQNLLVERHSAEGRGDNFFAALARNVVRNSPDLIIADSVGLVLAFKAATTTIPIVGITSDPVANGIVPSLARPGGNITGVSIDASAEVYGKRLELLREAIPGVSRVGFVASRGLWELSEGAAIRDAAEQMGISLIGPPFEIPAQEAEYRRVIAAMAQAGAEALFVGDQPVNATNQRVIIEQAEKRRLPAIFPYRDSVKLGGLMAYAPDIAELVHHLANEIAQILRGTSPGEIPYYQPTKFELIINLKTAKRLGIEMPSSLLAEADEVIE